MQAWEKNSSAEIFYRKFPQISTHDTDLIPYFEYFNTFEIKQVSTKCICIKSRIIKGNRN